MLIAFESRISDDGQMLNIPKGKYKRSGRKHAELHLFLPRDGL